MTSKRHPCHLCERRLAEPSLGVVCQHFAHGKYVTYEATSAPPGRVPDAACTACCIAYEERGPEGSKTAKAVERELGIHVVCRRCYDAAAKRNVLTSKRDRKRGYVLVPRAVHAALQGMKMSVAAELEVGGFAKVVFVPIPSRGREASEMMWVEIRRRAGEVFTGTLANAPGLFPKETLREGSKITFRETDVVAVDVGDAPKM